VILLALVVLSAEVTYAKKKRMLDTKPIQDISVTYIINCGHGEEAGDRREQRGLWV
jgi:hypothetical protein